MSHKYPKREVSRYFFVSFTFEIVGLKAIKFFIFSCLLTKKLNNIFFCKFHFSIFVKDLYSDRSYSACALYKQIVY